MSVRSFVGGFAVGFVSGVAFRSLAERDFEPVKDLVQTGVKLSQKVNDVLAESFGRFRETVSDLQAAARAARVEKTAEPEVAAGPLLRARVKKTAAGKASRRPLRAARVRPSSRPLHS